MDVSHISDSTGNFSDTFTALKRVSLRWQWSLAPLGHSEEPGRPTESSRGDMMAAGTELAEHAVSLEHLEEGSSYGKML